tara:strand:+ start:179 stop:877 length:699 start_codon:yes stop_codon:yes gene_type:complete
MSFTFGILTKDNNENIKIIIDSIMIQNIPDFEIIVVGNIENNFEKTIIIYDEMIEKQNWITKKKNIIIEKSSKDYTILMKDYIKLEKNWYNNFKMFVKDELKCEIIMNKIETLRGQRHIDWVWNNPNLKQGRNVDYKKKEHKEMFVPGSFLFAKTSILKKIKFNEKLVGLNKESDIEWSKRALRKYKYQMNIYSKCLIFTKRQFKYRIFRKACECNDCKITKSNETNQNDTI